MAGQPIRSVAVVDVGSSNAKAVHFAADLSQLSSRTMPVSPSDPPPYKSLDADTVLEFAQTAIREFDKACPVDVIAPCTHGSALALLDGNGRLALPIMSYMAEVPDDIAEAYEQIAPPFEEVLAPTNPGALTLGRQLSWQETRFPEAFARVRTILPYAQYLAYRLCGVLAAEVSALGAQTHLWAPRRAGYSTLARSRGWDRLFAPIRPAASQLGLASDLDLNGRGAVLCGVHDSNANFFRYAGNAPLVLLSTGTWIIAFDGGADLDDLDGRLDQASNTSVSGDPVACARFMGGVEHACLIGEDRQAPPTLGRVEALIAQGAWAQPSFTDSGGPVPGTGGQGCIRGPTVTRAADRASLAALYTAQMTVLSLNALGATRRVVVDGPFSGNDVYMALLAALMPARSVYCSLERNGTATGAALLAFGADTTAELSEPELAAVAPPHVAGLREYHETWLHALAR